MWKKTAGRRLIENTMFVLKAEIADNMIKLKDWNSCCFVVCKTKALNNCVFDRINTRLKEIHSHLRARVKNTYTKAYANAKHS